MVQWFHIEDHSRVPNIVSADAKNIEMVAHKRALLFSTTYVQVHTKGRLSLHSFEKCDILVPIFYIVS